MIRAGAAHLLMSCALLCTPMAALGKATCGPDDAEARPMIRYHVSFPQRQAHRVAVRMEVDDIQDDVLDLSMPVWTPGSYLVREFSRHVLELSAHQPDGGKLVVEKLNKNTWRVHTGSAHSVVIAYELHANERSVRTNHVDGDHAFLSPAATFLFVRGRTGEAYALEVDAPNDWQVFTTLSVHGDHWQARDYDQLVDSPVEVGPHQRLSFDLDGVPHYLVLAGQADLDTEQLVADVKKLTAEVAEVFGLLPFEAYTFILHLVDKGGGGLEHLDSSVCMTSRWKLADTKGYRRFLSLLAHEYFHAWNVKRFRPEGLGPFDYDREVYTTDLWVAEGITSYIDDLAVTRAGFVDKVGDYLGQIAKAFGELSRRPGAARMSLSRASADAWIKFYRPDENSPNSSVSYYSKGALVAMLLDLRVRRLTGGSASLRDVLRLGWQRYTERGVGYPPGALAPLASEVAGVNLSSFFAHTVDGTTRLEPNEDLAWIGLRLRVVPAETQRKLDRDEDGFALSPELGVVTRAAGGLCRVHTVLEDGPAHGAGLNVDDIILAVNDMRVTHDTLQDRLDRAGGGEVQLAFYRGQSLRTLKIQPALKRLEEWKLVPMEQPSDAQRTAFLDWCGWDLPAGEQED